MLRCKEVVERLNFAMVLAMRLEKSHRRYEVISIKNHPIP